MQLNVLIYVANVNVKSIAKQVYLQKPREFVCTYFGTHKVPSLALLRQEVKMCTLKKKKRGP